jgi:hypothetical protein
MSATMGPGRSADYDGRRCAPLRSLAKKFRREGLMGSDSRVDAA